MLYTKYLFNLNKMVQELKMTNSNLTKKQILHNYPENTKILSIIYDQMNSFNVTSANLLSQTPFCNYSNSQYQDIIHLLDDLAQRKITGSKIIEECLKFINDNITYKELILDILDKDLKCNINVKTINEIYPNLIQEFKVSLANHYEGGIDFTKERYYQSRKMDGVRVIAIKKDGNIRFYSRSGKEYFTLSLLKEPLLNIKEDYVLDGEVCLIKNNNEDFQAVMQEIRRKNHTISNPKYIIFDMLTLDEFYLKIPSRILSERLNKLNSINFNSQYVVILEQKIVVSEGQLLNDLDRACDSGWEGLMIRKDTHYEAKRTNNLLKIKKFLDNEYIVDSIEVGRMRFIRDSKICTEEVMVAANIIHNGHLVGVGSGWSIEQRREYKANPNNIIGKTIKVKYFQETNDNISLRFPSVVYIYNNDNINL